MNTEVGLEEWLDAVAIGEGYYYRCPQEHASLPPQHRCPECGGALERQLLPSNGKLRSYTESNVSIPVYEDLTPLTIAIATFGPVNITGRLPAVESQALKIGSTVRLDIEEESSDGSRIPIFRVVR